MRYLFWLSLISLSLSFNVFANNDYVKGEYVVKLKLSAFSSRSNTFASIGTQGNMKQLWSELNLYKVNLYRATDEESFEQELENDPNVEYVEKNLIYTTVAIPNDLNYSELWGMHGRYGIDAEAAWDISTGSSEVVVAVIDTGIDYNHKDLQANMYVNPGETGLDKNGKAKETNGIDDDKNGYVDDVHGWDFVNNDNDPYDDNKHGTHCAGTIGGVGNNKIGVAGVNWNVKLMALKFLSGKGSGTLSDAISSIKYAVDNGANVLSNSWGGGSYSAALKDAIGYAESKNITFVAAAGNDTNNNDKNPSYPASYHKDNVISVAAIASSGSKAYFTNYGKSTVHVSAPGVGIYSTVPGDLYNSLSGTSMACPHVSGMAALMLSVHPYLTPVEIRNIFISSSPKVSNLEDISMSEGRVSIKEAFAFLGLQNFRLAPSKIVLQEGQDFLLTSFKSRGEISYTSSDPVVATIDNGRINALKEGVVTIKAYDGANSEAQVVVEVVKKEKEEEEEGGCGRSEMNDDEDDYWAGFSMILPLLLLGILRRKKK